MSANTISSAIAHIPSRSTTGNATARPDRCPALHSMLHAAPKHGLSAALAKLVRQANDRLHNISALRQCLLTRTVHTKSP